MRQKSVTVFTEERRALAKARRCGRCGHNELFHHPTIVIEPIEFWCSIPECWCEIGVNTEKTVDAP